MAPWAPGTRSEATFLRGPMGPLGPWDPERSDFFKGPNGPMGPCPGPYFTFLYLKSCFEMVCAMVVQLIVQLDCAIPGGIVQLIVQIGRNRPQKCNKINLPGPIFQPGHQKCDEIKFSVHFPTRTPEV